MQFASLLSGGICKTYAVVPSLLARLEDTEKVLWFSSVMSLIGKMGAET
jgi:hypothetical protein